METVWSTGTINRSSSLGRAEIGYGEMSVGLALLAAASSEPVLGPGYPHRYVQVHGAAANPAI